MKCLQNSISSMQRDVSFIPAVSCGPSSGSTDLPLPAYLAFILYQHCFRKAFGKNLTWKWAAQLVRTGGSPGAQHGEVNLPFPRAFWAQWHTDWGHQQGCIIIPGIHVLLDEFSCSNEEGVASEAVTAPAGCSLPSRNDHWPWCQFFRKKPCMYYYVFVALMMSHRNISVGCYCKFCLLKSSILSWLPSTTD